MKLLVDMNLSPAWVDALRQAGWEAVHWSEIGNPRGTDAEIMARAREEHWVVFTNDLDFGALLAHSRAGKPSVLQVRARDVSPDKQVTMVIDVLRRFTTELESGALMSLDETSQRVRLLPLGG